jgi:hypothetical protein
VGFRKPTLQFFDRGVVVVINKLPALSDPVRYTGLYIFDFGDHVSVGYTAEEIEYLLDDPRYTDGTVYKIYRAHPDGTLEIRSIEPQNWGGSTGMVFYFPNRDSANEGFNHLRELAKQTQPPENFELIVVDLVGEDWPVAMVMQYNQEYEDELAAWMVKIDYRLGSDVEGGKSGVIEVIKKGTEVLHEHIGADRFHHGRSRVQVLNSVDLAVQR